MRGQLMPVAPGELLLDVIDPLGVDAVENEAGTVVARTVADGSAPSRVMPGDADREVTGGRCGGIAHHGQRP